ncbi:MULTISPECIES: phosphoserine phosphatase SerB [unclassified Gemella]|uniref:phosphoserine phosphatase SerB n=1 Tax=unclassified Gemella TaxID=2624949 RepID=UPI0015D01051|nr:MULTISPECIES: phosphoserine phosphatase SerB [unclassified Gemella]MBF0710662.1 phosphoserine phosphatase SerB [Gemella sp. GL1.1]NYS28006.1 phosphoserine phosphatase SerB [Gemella sp. GL1]
MAKALLVMDVDSTLIAEEVIDLLGNFAGKGEIIAEITEAAMNGELDFGQALEERVKLLAGLPDTIFSEVAKQVSLRTGAKDLINELHRRDYKIGLVSGGFHEIVDILAADLGIDYVKANRLEVMDGRLSGKISGDIVTRDTKEEYLKKWAEENKLNISQTIAMGDGANDIPMILTAGLGVAFCAKKLVREQATYQINEPNLLLLLDIIDKELERSIK